MELSSFTIRIILLFFPGIVATALFRLLSNKGNIDNREYFVKSLIYSFLSYGILILLSLIINMVTKCTFFNALADSSVPINYIEVLMATIIAILVSIGSLYISNYNLLYKIGTKIKITTNTGEIDVWGELFNNSNKGIEDYVYIIFLDKKIIYGGAVSNFSLFGQNREVVLNNVRVFEDIGERQELRSMEKAYLQFTKDDNVIIEIVANKNEEKK